jgi:hypothetical protein
MVAATASWVFGFLLNFSEEIDMSESSQAAPKTLTVAELETIPNWRALSPADEKVLGLMLTKRMAMGDAIVALYPTMSPSQVQSAIGFLMVDYRVREVLNFVGIKPPVVPGVPVTPVAVAKPAPTERIDLVDLWARPEFNNLALTLPCSSEKYRASIKLDTQKILAFYFTIALRSMAKAIILTNPNFTDNEVAEIVTAIQLDQNIQYCLALVGELDGK